MQTPVDTCGSKHQRSVSFDLGEKIVLPALTTLELEISAWNGLTDMALFPSPILRELSLLGYTGTTDRLLEVLTQCTCLKKLALYSPSMPSEPAFDPSVQMLETYTLGELDTLHISYLTGVLTIVNRLSPKLQHLAITSKPLSDADTGNVSNMVSTSNCRLRSTRFTLPLYVSRTEGQSAAFSFLLSQLSDVEHLTAESTIGTGANDPRLAGYDLNHLVVRAMLPSRDSLLLSPRFSKLEIVDLKLDAALLVHVVEFRNDGASQKESQVGRIEQLKLAYTGALAAGSSACERERVIKSFASIAQAGLPGVGMTIRRESRTGLALKRRIVFTVYSANGQFP